MKAYEGKEDVQIEEQGIEDSCMEKKHDVVEEIQKEFSDSKVGIGRETHKKKKMKSMSPFMRIFLVSILITVVLIGMVALAGVTVYNTFVYDEGNQSQVMSQQPSETVGGGLGGEVLTEPVERINKTVAIFGTDITGKLTDVIFIAHFDSETKEISLIAVPRDTKVDWNEEQIKLLPSQHQWVRTGKINEMTSWGGTQNIRPLTISTIERLMGIKIDEYVIVNLNAFREIVDAIGGVEVEVKQYMKKDDFSQNLHIDLKPGVQVLDGDKAEQFVRFRSYPTGDIGRIQAQQEFMKAFATKLLSAEMITKLPELSAIAFSSVKTDISLREIPSYFPYIQNVKLENLHFYTLPGQAHYEDNISYYFLDLDEVNTLVDTVFLKNE